MSYKEEFKGITHSRQRERIVELTKENVKLIEKKQRATELIAELKKENQQLESTIRLMDENAKSTKNYFTEKHNHYKKMFGFTEIGVLNRNQELEKRLKETTQGKLILQETIKRQAKEEILLREFLREKGLLEEASIYFLDNMEEEE